MNYTYMKVFYTVAKYQNISKASKELDVSQPAVSRIISNLEEEYNTKLFTRSKSGVNLTREGLFLFETIKHPYAELEKIDQHLGKSITNLQEVVVHVGATATALYCYVFKYLEKTKKIFPNVNFRIYSDSSSNLLEKVDKGELDYAFITTPFKEKNNLEVHNLYKLETILLAPISYKDKVNGSVSIKEMNKYPFILLNSEMQFREHIDEFLNEHGVKIRPSYETNSSSNLLPLCENNYGFTFIPYDMALPGIEDGKCFKVDLKEEIPHRYVSFVIKKEAAYSNIIYEIKKVILDRIEK